MNRAEVPLLQPPWFACALGSTAPCLELSAETSLLVWQGTAQQDISRDHTWGRPVELAVGIGRINYSNTKWSVWFLNEGLHRGVSLEITPQPPRETPNPTGAPPEPLVPQEFSTLKHEGFEAFQTVFPLKSLLCSQANAPHSPSQAEGRQARSRIYPSIVKSRSLCQGSGLLLFWNISGMSSSSSTANQDVVTHQQAHWCNTSGAECLFPEWFLEEILDQPENALLLLPQDFLRCVTAAIIYFAISIAAFSKYSDGASKAAGVSNHELPTWVLWWTEYGCT